MVQKNDFVEIEYTGKTEDGIIFDTTDANTAKAAGFEHHTPGPVIVAIGSNQVLSGLDKSLEGKEVGKEYSVKINPEDAFGKKSAKLVQLIPTRKFTEQQIMPQPGLQVNIDGMMGIIKTVSGGRTLVDFNHPLSGRALVYNFKILRKVEDDKEKLQGYMKITFGDAKTEIVDGKATVTLSVKPGKEIEQEFSGKIKELIPTITELEFKEEVKEKKAPVKKQA